ncbi:type II toxin-antitoxin system Phd/YefM family antitoxin [Xenorhabdus sp. DI]|uniref:type II toxin-antitoxin system Phd/YefM family antitoxin n=1 Tax=Xenorhabdus TaxID=626 RepID=UPI00199FFB85|nr:MULTISPECIES: type II toxin-antitoxin system Phd/YefM family antitoxin [unclassified Xenorhabdus]MBD2785360.1 type II toxin-antitoxin system Phd/YefM family antitoxin [Xenorhabdus sp. 3]MBD2789504.1 type II toxin-antitoxin system Phd/YefM family antitoxin [Xenorhabdus sp. DI]MBD2796506.1 type II toxin-antitoxin system Phd/YefM family antitoxin [Xenorhabdus sp. 18]MDC9592165.1 type II toxin-antitoxin system Phd/YefM family antitoxin [Xenorhabdus sp. IM139775]
MNTFTISHARENLAAVIDQAVAGHPVEITRYGRETAVIISKKEFDALQKAKLDAEFADIVGLFDTSNQALADR